MSEGSIIRETDRSFGFSWTHRGNDPRLHVSAVEGPTVEFQRVSFVAMRDSNGARAEKVRAL